MSIEFVQCFLSATGRPMLTFARFISAQGPISSCWKSYPLLEAVFPDELSFDRNIACGRLSQQDGRAICPRVKVDPFSEESSGMDCRMLPTNLEISMWCDLETFLATTQSLLRHMSLRGRS